MSQSFQNGNIEKRRRKDGTVAFRVRYWVRTASGEWKRKTETLPRRVKTLRQAEKELDQLLRPVNDTAGYGRAACGATFKNLMEDYWPVYVSNQNMRPSTLDSYGSTIGKWIEPFFGDMHLDAITPRTVTDFMAKKLIPANLASKTRRNIYNLLSEIFEVGVDNQLILENPVRPRVHRPAVIQEEKPTLPLEKFWTLICELPTRRDKALVWTIALTGCRVGEALALRRRSIDIENRLIHFTHVVYRNRLIPGLKETRKRRRRRQLTVGLCDLLARVLEDLMARSEFLGPDDLLFHRPDGRPVEPSIFRNDILYPAMGRARIPLESRATGLHLFRHTAGSLLNKKTADLKRVQVQLGHADIGTTADVYTHVDLDTVHQNAADLESVFLEACGGFGPILGPQKTN
jgi:integrase